MNVLVRILRLQEQQLRNNQVGHMVFDRAHSKYHPLLKQPGINIKRALPTGGLLYHHGHQP